MWIYCTNWHIQLIHPGTKYHYSVLLREHSDHFYFDFERENDQGREKNREIYRKNRENITIRAQI